MPIRLGAERHDQRMHAEDADADAVGEADQHGREQRDQDRDRRVVLRHLRRHDEGAHRGDGADRQIDAAGQHGQRLAGGEDGERNGELDGVGDPALVDDAGAEQLEDDDERDEQDDQRDERPVAHEAADAPAERRRRGCSLAQLMRAASASRRTRRA